ncbi:TPR repeat protein [Penicillium longicatenatum]|nr:TPR repeat protein [Penicillium longicatenatum]
MSGLKVIGGISAVISLLDASIKIYDSAHNVIHLSTTFEVIRRRLPILLYILETCKSHLELRKDSLHGDVCLALEMEIDACGAKASNLKGIFERTIPGESDIWEKRYLQILRRLGIGKKVEELLGSITETVQVVVNHQAVQSANARQNLELDNIIKEMKSIYSVSDRESSPMTLKSGGGATQINNVNSGNDQRINNNASVGNLNLNPVTMRQNEDLSFRGVGVCLGQAPYIAPELFVGRCSEIREIAKVLQPLYAPGKQQRLFLGGIGGIGKTQLAIAYADSYRESYTSVFRLNAASEAALKDSFRTIASFVFSVQDPAILDDEEIVERVHLWLSDLRNTRWLLIYDNYNGFSQFAISDYFPPAPQGAVLVTTRRLNLVSGSTLNVKPLNIADGLAVLQTRSKRENVQSDSSALRLAERLDGLPIVLATAGTYLKRTGFTFERYLQEYEKHWNTDAGRPIQLEEHERRLNTTLNLSYTHLKTENPDAAKLLKLLAYFDNQRLWYGLFHAGLSNDSPDWLRIVLASDLTFRRTMEILAQYSFLGVDEPSRSWSMHDCIHSWALAALNKNIDIENYWFAFDCVSSCTEGVDEDLLGYVAFSRYTGHATRLVAHCVLKEDIISSSRSDRFDKVSRVSILLREQSQLASAEQMSLQLLAGREKALGPDHPLTLDTAHNLANIYRDQRKLDQAEEMYKRALGESEKVLGPDHMSTLDTIYHLGILYHDQGNLDKAEEMYMRALAGYKNALELDQSSTLDTANSP